MRLVFADHEPHLKPNPRRDHMSGVPELSYSVLDRHGGRVLAPGQVIRSAGRAAPRGTVYRFDQLLVSEQILADAESIRELTAAVARTGMLLEVAAAARAYEGQTYYRVPLLSSHGDYAAVDAWSLLQRLTHVASEGLPEGLIEGVRLEHLLTCEKGASPPGLGTGEPPIGSRDFSFRRKPVDMLVAMPGRTPKRHRFRIAVLDTGVPAQHPWFDVSDQSENMDTFVIVNHEFQARIGEHANSPAPPLDEPWDGPVHEPTLIGEIASHFGHGAFTAGILRQISPDAQVYSLRVAHSDGMAHEFEVTAALTHIAEQVEAFRSGDKDAVNVDQVLVPMGYVTEEPDDAFEGGLRDAVERLALLGIPIVAAAGNQASDRPFYPAALAAYRHAEPGAPVISVGALNLNRSIAVYSNEGPWIGCYATGTDLVSAFPIEAHGSRMPERRAKSYLWDRYRENPDAFDFSSGCAIWSGTSFAAAVASGFLCDAMEETEAYGSDAAGLAKRAHEAYRRLRRT
ncbi:S8 family peptidase [Glycomyces albidus]|uniref:S8 family serine peptidase n=1 Tax=Glycomyces albidus TaxID=2656774 RepID=A0A6L5G4Q9_9ACTN|nr:S8/S53 family peptidase [Glycomyces albidus]MQM24621.1 S8 family serine peptidase [Glycomyces albidus]